MWPADWPLAGQRTDLCGSLAGGNLTLWQGRCCFTCRVDVFLTRISLAFYLRRPLCIDLVFFLLLSLVQLDQPDRLFKVSS